MQSLQKAASPLSLLLPFSILGEGKPTASPARGETEHWLKTPNPFPLMGKPSQQLFQIFPQTEVLALVYLVYFHKVTLVYFPA